VLDRLLDEATIDIIGVTGTSGAGISGAILVDGLVGGGPTLRASLVRLFRVQRRALLRTAIRHPLWRWRAICLPTMLWLVLCEPTGNGAASPLEPSAEDQDEARWRCRLA
jgi:hypothetical protein